MKRSTVEGHGRALQIARNPLPVVWVNPVLERFLCVVVAWFVWFGVCVGGGEQL